MSIYTVSHAKQLWLINREFKRAGVSVCPGLINIIAFIRFAVKRAFVCVLVCTYRFQYKVLPVKRDNG